MQLEIQGSIMLLITQHIRNLISIIQTNVVLILKAKMIWVVEIIKNHR